LYQAGGKAVNRPVRKWQRSQKGHWVGGDGGRKTSTFTFRRTRVLKGVSAMTWRQPRSPTVRKIVHVLSSIATTADRIAVIGNIEGQ